MTLDRNRKGPLEPTEMDDLRQSLARLNPAKLAFGEAAQRAGDLTHRTSFEEAVTLLLSIFCDSAELEPVRIGARVLLTELMPPVMAEVVQLITPIAAAPPLLRDAALAQEFLAAALRRYPGEEKRILDAVRNTPGIEAERIRFLCAHLVAKA